MLSPEKLWKYWIFDTKKLDEIFDIGYKHTLERIDDVFTALEFDKAVGSKNGKPKVT